MDLKLQHFSLRFCLCGSRSRLVFSLARFPFPTSCSFWLCGETFLVLQVHEHLRRSCRIESSTACQQIGETNYNLNFETFCSSSVPGIQEVLNSFSSSAIAVANSRHGLARLRFPPGRRPCCRRRCPRGATLRRQIVVESRREGSA